MKLTENNGSFKTTIPKSKVEDMGWKDGTELTCKKVGKKLVLTIKEK